MGIYCGVDIGSRSIEVVLFDGAQVVESAVLDTGASPKENARMAMERAVSSAGLGSGDIKAVIATGYGRNYFDLADKSSSEILCHAQGVSYLFPNVKTVIDIGGQDSKLISVNGGGRVDNFVMNDRCAAGTGKFIEMVCHTLQIPIDQAGDIAGGTNECCEISSMCAVFAESEIIGLIQSGTPVEVVLRGVFRSIARRIMSMAGRVSFAPEIVFTGGVALNKGIVRAIEEETGAMLSVPHAPQFTGALGAAIIASRNGSGG